VNPLRPPPLTADLVEAFSGAYLSHRYDEASRTPPFHRECWRLYCDETIPAAAVAAPRTHAKTTALTHDFITAAVLFRWAEFVLILGSSEDLAKENLANIAEELRNNQPLREDFAIASFVVDQKTDVIVERTDGSQFRILARGAEQLIRGLMWHGKRPGLIVADDIEGDEQVASKDRRITFKRWFFRAARQALREGGKIRVHGTIMHDDSLLANLMKNKSWAHRLYKAHRAFDDFSDILWPARFTEASLRAKRQEFIDARDAEGYAQEYLNDPRDSSDAYLHREWFAPMSDDERALPKLIAVGVDLAISKADRANRTSFSVGGKDLRNELFFVGQEVGRWDAFEICERFFTIHERWHPEVYFVEDGVIWKAISSTINAEMSRREVYLNIVPIWPIKDKASRGRSLQARMRAGACKFDKDAEWYPGFEDELLRFTGNAEATLDDQFDSAALLCRGLESWSVESEDMMSDEELAFERESQRLRASGGAGRSTVTGY
jgi:hypothetical protein